MTATVKDTRSLGELLRERHRMAVEQFEAQLAEAMQLRGSSSEPGDVADLGALVADTEQMEIVTATLRQQVLRLQEAVDRFDAGRYGTCESCGNGIPQARLELLPWATQCVPCQERAERY
jgi:RNA polymerase-binding transcription factor